MSKIGAWVVEARLRTLPLAAAAIVLGGALAFRHGVFSVSVFVLALLTAVLLQILSNFANDYGDAEKGLDDETRLGPQRAMSSGEITPADMRKALVITACLTFLTGAALVFTAFPGDFVRIAAFGVLGVASMLAAVWYTMGKHPYGYAGLGDISSFFFFGIVGVAGSYYLFSGELTGEALFLGCSDGLLVAAVLNVNNMRDREDDEKKGKKSLAVRIGDLGSRIYHGVLICGAFILFSLYVFIFCRSYVPFVFVLGFSLLFYSAWNAAVIGASRRKIDPELKRTSVGALLVSILLAAGMAAERLWFV